MKFIPFFTIKMRSFPHKIFTPWGSTKRIIVPDMSLSIRWSDEPYLSTGPKTLEPLIVFRYEILFRVYSNFETDSDLDRYIDLARHLKNWVVACINTTLIRKTHFFNQGSDLWALIYNNNEFQPIHGSLVHKFMTEFLSELSSSVPTTGNFSGAIKSIDTFDELECLDFFLEEKFEVHIKVAVRDL
jgi:hypothetical protein